MGRIAPDLVKVELLSLIISSHRDRGLWSNSAWHTAARHTRHGTPPKTTCQVSGPQDIPKGMCVDGKP